MNQSHYAVNGQEVTDILSVEDSCQFKERRTKMDVFFELKPKLGMVTMEGQGARSKVRNRV